MNKILFFGFLIFSWFYLYFQLPSGLLEVTFLNIGQGDSIFIRTPQNHQVLIDGGPDSKVVQELTEVLSFFDKSLDLVILTHPDADHLTGLIPVLERFQVDNVYLTGLHVEKDDYDHFLKLINDKQINLLIASSKDDLKLGDFYIDVLFPFINISGQTSSAPNNTSIITKLHHGNRKILLSGDAEEEIEDLLIKKGIDLSADIFKAGHHGSKTSSTLPFLQKIQPETVVIQAGIDNKFGHPHPEVIRNFHLTNVKNIYSNPENGRIKIKFLKADNFST